MSRAGVVRQPMVTDFVRDQAFTIAWLAMMAFVWFGWAQEDPPQSWRWKPGVGASAGLVLAVVFGYAAVSRWSGSSALDGRYEWFGLLVLVEVALAGAGAAVVSSRGQGRWIAWWVALVVAVHFLPLAIVLRDWSIGVLGLVQAVGLVLMWPGLRGASASASRLVGPLMGTSLVAFAAVSAVGFIATEGAPW